MTHKTQPTAHAEITAPISADLRRIDDSGAKSAPITLMTEDRACTWAWDQVQQDVGAKGWTAGDSCNFHGFFLWGWNYRGQYETQLSAAPPAPAAVAVPECFFSYCDDDGFNKHDTLEAAKAASQDMIDMLREEAGTDEWPGSTGSVCYGVIVGQSTEVPCEHGPSGEETADYVLLAAAPAQEHATQLAGHGQEPTDRQRVDAFMHFMLTNCTNPELQADEERNIRDMVGILGQWRSGAHDDYLGERHGRELREVGGRKPGESAGSVRGRGAPGGSGDIDSLAAAPAQAQENAQDAVRALIATHAEMLEHNAYAYFELAYTRQTGWMAWITDKPLYGAPVVNPDRKVLANGQGDTPDEACADAARAAQGGAA